MAEIDLQALIADPRALYGAEPPAGDAATRSTRDHPAYEYLDGEFRRTETHGPAAIDWRGYNAAATDLVRAQSKDLIVGTRLTYGLFRAEGYKGLAIGLSILEGMVSAHWDTLFPPLGRDRTRAGAFDWLSDKMALAVEAAPPGSEGDKTFALVAHERLIALDAILSEMLKVPVALGPLKRALHPFATEARARLEAVEIREDTAPPEQSALTAVPEAAGLAPAVTSPPPARATAPVPILTETGEGSEKAFQSLFAAAGRVAASVRPEAPCDPRTYLAARFAAWGQIVSPPPDTAGKTMLPPPPKARLSELKAVQAAGNHLVLLSTAESAFVTSPFWLDAQRTIAEAMLALGAEFDLARKVVIRELGSFLARFPNLAELTFSDGTPFADSETRGWIADEAGASGPAGARKAGDLDLEIAAAEKLGRAGQIIDGLKTLSSYAERQPGERERFLTRIEIGEYCLRFNLLQPFTALVDSLWRTEEARALSSWEPRLSTAIANLAWRGLTHRNVRQILSEKEMIERKARILATLSELDMPMAAQLEQSLKSSGSGPAS